MIEATGAQIVVKLLERQGITTVAGIPGGSVLPLYDELAKSSIRHVLVRHEQGGGFLAQGMARSTGNPAVCIATSGPGAMNLLTAIADARADSIPIVAITGQVTSSLIGTDAFQEVDTFGLSFPIAKHSVMVKSAAELLDVLPKAFSLAASGRPGPVLVDIPRDVQTQKATFESWPEPGRAVRRAEQFRSSPQEFASALSAAAVLLSQSAKPVLYAGGGCNSPEAASGIARLLEVFPMPVVTSLMGIGCVPRDSACLLGMVGMHGSMAANRAMHDADAVVAVGARFDDRATGLIRKFCPDAKIIHIDIDAAEVNKILPSGISVIADAESALPVLAGMIDELDSERKAISARKSWLDRLAGVRDKAEAKENARIEASSRAKRGTSAGLGDGLADPRSFIASIPAAMRAAGIDPDTAIVTTDVGQHQMWTAQRYPFSRPRQFLTSGSLGTMGFGLPAAIGAALANPGRRVVCVSGDGSIMMNIQELATLAEEGLDVTVIVLDNGALGMVRQQQELLFARNFSACLFAKSPDLAAIAAAFGLRTVDASEPGWEEAAFAGRGPRFLRVRIPQEENVYPFVPAGKANVEAIEG
ncbi:MAG TPA: biosynthetic-type acetolactate synthase large subunit [Treponemataceae bacterium]|nr:biosynthetic-type acetolactate synthase large subunit [Treponemataceae bacterium]